MNLISFGIVNAIGTSVTIATAYTKAPKEIFLFVLVVSFFVAIASSNYYTDKEEKLC